MRQDPQRAVRGFTITLAVLISVFSCCPVDAQQESPTSNQDGWQALFNGKSLEGWTQKNGWASYRVEDESIVGTTAKASPNAFLCSVNEYADFELEFEVKCASELNSGVQIRSSTAKAIGANEFLFGRVNGPQVEIESGNGVETVSGYIYGEATGRGWLVADDVRKPHTHFKNNEWNRYRIVAKGSRIITFINGEMICDLDDEAIYESHPSGFIGLQVHGVGSRGPFEVRWRNIRIKKLTGAE